MDDASKKNDLDKLSKVSHGWGKVSRKFFFLQEGVGVGAVFRSILFVYNL